jgi:hypothetical protein
MKEAIQTSETLVKFYQSTWHYNPEDSHLHTHCHENLKSHHIYHFGNLSIKREIFTSLNTTNLFL